MTIEDTLRTLISKELGLDEAEITRDATFREDLRADSLDCQEICMCVEETLHVEIDDDTMETLTTFGALVECVEKLVDRSTLASRGAKIGGAR